MRSQNGVLEVELTIHNHKEKDGSTRFCYIDEYGNESPNLRVKPGDLVVLRLKNDLRNLQGSSVSGPHDGMAMDSGSTHDSCASGTMASTSTNLHFHGLTVPPVCHQDDVLNTSIEPGNDPPSSTNFAFPPMSRPDCIGITRIFTASPRRRCWAEPRARSSWRVSSARIKQVAGLPERVLIIRDQDLLNPNAPPSKSEPVVPKMLIDRDGDAANNGTGFGKPAKDLSINFVPVPYPDYPPAVIQMKPQERQLWRVLNASAITYLNLEVLFNRAPQQLGIVALDGVPLNQQRNVRRLYRLAHAHRHSARGAR